MKKILKQLASYFIVGGTAAIVEWVSFFVCDAIFLWNYLLSTTTAFLVATFVNWFMGKRMTFKEQNGNSSQTKEFMKVYFVSFLGLIWNLLLMTIFTQIVSLYPLIAKIMATGIVFFWNFFARKFWVYNC